jgi:phosphate-selective porin OprO/OprP
MIPLSAAVRHAPPAAALGVLLVAAGCDPDRPSRSAASVAGTNHAVGIAELAATEARLNTFTNQFAQAQQAQAEVIRRLQEQLAQVERQQAERATATSTERAGQAAALKAAEERSGQLATRLAELENKLQAVEAGRVLPEIAVAAEEGPTTRELEQQLKVVERNRELAAEASEAKAKEAPKFSAGAGGLSFTSGDGNFAFKVRGMVQADAQVFFNDNPLLEGNDGFYLRRVRTAFQGNLFKDFEYLIIPQYGGLGQDQIQILDAAVAYKFGDYEARIGKFKGPVGLELLQSIAALPFNERSLVSNLVPQRNVGAQFSGKLWDDTVSFAAGVFNNSGDQRNPANFDYSDDKEFAGRVFFQPFKQAALKPLQGFGFGLGGSYSQVSSNAVGLPRVGATVPGYSTTPGNQQFFAYNPTVGPVVADGVHWRLSPQGTFYYGPFGLMGEYALSNQDVYNSTTFRSAKLSHDAWQLTAEWVLTGEAASYAGINPLRPFSLHGGGWGAWQLVGRYSKFDVDDDAFPTFANPLASATGATSWSVGVNWWLNRNVRVLSSFTHTTFEGGGAPVNVADPATITAPATVTAQDENVLSTRVQLSF